MSKKHQQKKDNKTENNEIKKDKSEFIFQNEKLKIELNIRDFNWTEKQKAFIGIALDNKTNYIFCQAPAGVGKTLLSVYIGLKLLQEGKVRNIYFVRNPVESSSHGLGFLGGDFHAKMDPYVQPMMDHLNELLPSSQVKALLEAGFIQSIPVGFLKGRTFNSSLIIADEAEDFTVNDFRLIMGRLGKRSKMLLIGDSEQVNIKNTGFMKTFDVFNSPECEEIGIYCLSFGTEDIMRNKILGYVIERFKFVKN
jgi:phosphate starvation-inducible PhoH-like protein